MGIILPNGDKEMDIENLKANLRKKEKEIEEMREQIRKHDKEIRINARQSNTNPFEREKRINARQSNANPFEREKRIEKDQQNVRRQPETENRVGFNVRPTEGTATDLIKVRDKMKKLSDSYVSKLEQYKERQKKFKELANGYVHNLRLVFDVSKVLNLYMDTFEKISSDLSHSEEALRHLNPDDLKTLKELTKGSLYNMSGSLLEEVNKLRSIFNRNKDLNKHTPQIDSIEQGIKQMQFGGSKNKPCVKKRGSKVKGKRLLKD